MIRLILFLFVSIFLSYILYRLYNTQNVKDKFIKRVYNDRYHILLVLIVCIIAFSFNKHKNKYKYIPFFITIFIIIELLHTLTWDDHGNFIGFPADPVLIH